jgi:hypothetical protein
MAAVLEKHQRARKLKDEVRAIGRKRVRGLMRKNSESRRLSRAPLEHWDPFLASLSVGQNGEITEESVVSLLAETR